MKGLKIAFWALVFLLGIAYFYWFLPVWGIPFNGQRQGNPPLTPAWALECWLWEDDVNTSDYVDELLRGYKEYDIPVRTVLLDSPWSVRYNDFEIDTIRYKDPEVWFPKLQDEGYRIVLWMTPMVNSYSNDTRVMEDRTWYDDSMEKGFLAKSKSPNEWWKGEGGFIDYSNPKAMDWWRGLQQNVFDLGIDGWKLDGAATLFYSEIGALPFFYKKTSSGWMSTRTYMDYYYRDEYTYGLTQNPEFLTLSRAIDRGYHPEGFAPIDASPVNWVGDQKHEWVTDKMIKENDNPGKDIALKGVQGFESAIDNILKSAKLGYNIVGSDVGGFSGSTIPPRLYIRWAQFSSFCGLFLNGGHGERRLWKRTDQELRIIRNYAWLHTELVPYMYHYVISAHNGGRKLQTPLKQGKYQYMFGDDFLIAPIYKDAGLREVVLPEGKWRYFFDDTTLLEGPLEFEREFPLHGFPVYIKEGAIVPMDVKREYTGLGDIGSEGFITVLIYPEGDNTFTYYDVETSRETIISYVTKNRGLNISFKGGELSHILRIHSEKAPQTITLDNRDLPQQMWKYDPKQKKLIIRSAGHFSNGAYRINY
ncbi:TIM-barrel domain-containing protein [Maribacter polysiphoniae]|uniref:TIM-barrel domain-containing protein n=1 Tax=Maribacter polysiphoniae TaxID=429344 RepID=UPI002356A7A1|nr:TIM-barrel domain-containing protein [Maribacter polysiphoniae]